ncbi:hypothetical protein CU097_001237, partial [Rhizopus azygosporus]
DLMISNFPGCYEFPDKGWANSCLILCKIRVQEHIGTMPINTFIALGLFLTSRAIDINDTLCPNDPTIQYLYSLALQRHQSQFNAQHISDTLMQLLETQDQEKYNDAIGEASSSISITISTATATTNPTNIESIDFTVESITQYERSMTFVENYVETRKQKGFKQMDRADMLRNQYKNYIKLVNNW